MSKFLCFQLLQQHTLRAVTDHYHLYPQHSTTHLRIFLLKNNHHGSNLETMQNITTIERQTNPKIELQKP